MKANGSTNFVSRKIFLWLGAPALFCSVVSLGFHVLAYETMRERSTDPVAFNLIEAALYFAGLSVLGCFAFVGFFILRRPEAPARNDDMMELKASHAQMLHASRMTALGEMAGNVAHNINNPLAVIQIRNAQMLEFIEEGKLSSEEARKTCVTIEAMCMRITRVINSMRMLARDSSSDGSSLVSVRKVIDDALILVKESLKRQSVELEIAPIPEGLDVFCNGTQTVQIIMHLISNAVDALTEVEGPRRIRLSAVGIGREVHFRVKDNGGGIPPELRERIFVPFFSTRRPGGSVSSGSGLGLSISRGLASSQGGELRLDTADRETTFVLILPAVPAVLKKGDENGKKVSA